MYKNISFYHQNGYLIIKNIINKNVIDQIQESIYLRASNYIPKLKKNMIKIFIKKIFIKLFLNLD